MRSRRLPFVLIVCLFLLIGNLFVPRAWAETDVYEDSTPTKILKKPPIIPNLQVLIPGFDTTDIVVMGATGTPCKEGDLCVYTIDRYLNAVYRWGAGAGVIIAIVLMMMGGVEWMVGSAVGTIQKGKQRITNAVIGLLLILTATTFLNFINPNITKLSGIAVRVIQPAGDTSTEVTLGGDKPASIPDAYLQIPFSEPLTTAIPPPLAPPVATPPSSTPSTASPTKPASKYASASDITVGFCLQFASGVQVSSFILPVLEQAACALRWQTRGQFSVYLTDALRPPATQAQYWFNNCYKKAGSRTSSFSCSPLTCNPFPRTPSASPVTTSGTMSSGPFTLKPEISKAYPTDAALLDYLKDLADNNTQQQCAHPLGTTVDAWCAPHLGNFTDDADCHYWLEQAMKQNGYNRIASEPWHFEYAAQGFVPPTANARNGAWTDGRMVVTKKYCDTSVLGPSCIFDYSVCRASQGGSGYTNLQRGCCSDKTGACIRQ